MPIPAELEAEAEEWRAKLLDVVATEDDELMEKYLADEELTVADIQRAIRAGTLTFSFVPVLCGSAFKNKGVQPMLDAVVDYLPSPARHPARHRASTSRASRCSSARPTRRRPFAALAFKIVADPYGKLTYFRVYSGTHRQGRRGLQLHQGPQGAARPHPA